MCWNGARGKGAVSDVVILPICQAINPPNGSVVQISCELEVLLVADWEIEHDARARSVSAARDDHNSVRAA